MTTEKLKTAPVLAFERKLSNSDGFMYAGDWDDIGKSDAWRPVSVENKDVRGVISNRLKNAETSDEAKLDAKIEDANLQTVETASLPIDADTLKLSFTLRVLGDLKTPSVCNNPRYQEKLESVIQSYIDKHQFEELARRYAANIANGRFLWRNQIGADEVKVEVRQIVDREVTSRWIFNTVDFGLRDLSGTSDSFSQMVSAIQNGLLGDSFTLFEIDAYARLGRAQEVFPSQELVLDTAGETKKSKYLYAVSDIAAMHSQKLGNALRTIDTWYPDSDGIGPIAVEPYGSVTSRGKAYRQPKQKMDFYSLLDAWVLKDKVPEIDQQHYVMAVLIRGGVFGESS